MHDALVSESSGLLSSYLDSQVMTSLCFAYYCSGHGYGHATRVSAFARHLKGLELRPTIYIISSAPQHVFEDSISVGVTYRYAEIDPVIIQPVAYRVDRQRSIHALRSFLSKKDIVVQQEKRWLLSIGADCILTDAAFLGCLAAHAASLPSILITNFTFDSVYSYLATSYTDRLPSGSRCRGLLLDEKEPDEPISDEDIRDLVQQIYQGYRCANFLVRLPGFIPIPSFFASFPLPAPSWTDQEANKLLPEVVHHLTKSQAESELHDIIHFSRTATPNKCQPRFVIQAPLLVRGITTLPESVYTPAGRSRFLLSIGVPGHLHDPDETKILIVSFGGQVFRKPSSSRGSSTWLKSTTPPERSFIDCQDQPNADEAWLSRSGNDQIAPHTTKPTAFLAEGTQYPNVVTMVDAKLTTTTSISSCDFDAMVTTSPTPVKQAVSELEPQLLPDSSWIAVVCGMSKEQWAPANGEDGLPDNFFVAPKYVYMPDLTAVADALLGKLVGKS
ncbi:hypothetical protein PAXRUDRAFT_833609 [Paxillus rubicundulus Ve08.2h10]|uniref:L-arabinokinase n=1 Tax=Paxillus rubicundulus Ve08.2h10 TaxID=930991 RepID=A0A0D0D949_9AGAM|nr:hypothetical protein PAXRUDRAFT_833609 [Paxillus rubicundulus Ve08.2h10]